MKVQIIYPSDLKFGTKANYCIRTFHYHIYYTHIKSVAKPSPSCTRADLQSNTHSTTCTLIHLVTLSDQTDMSSSRIQRKLVRSFDKSSIWFFHLLSTSSQCNLFDHARPAHCTKVPHHSQNRENPSRPSAIASFIHSIEASYYPSRLSLSLRLNN